MPVFHVTNPQGHVIEVNAPEGATEADAIAYAQKNPPKEVGKFEAVTTGLAHAIPFMNDIAAGATKAINGGDYDTLKRQFDAKEAAAMDQHPIITGVSQMAGTVPLMAMAPSSVGNFLNSGSLLAKAGKGAMLGAGIGATYGTGQGLGTERVSNAIDSGVYGAAGGAAGSLVAPLLSGAAKSVARSLRPATEEATRAAALGLDLGNWSAGLDAAGADVGAVSRGRLLPLTKGQSLQDPSLQSLESAATTGAHGDEAKMLMEKVRSTQSNQARGFIEGQAGGAVTDMAAPQEAAQQAIKNVTKSYKAAKNKTNAAYNAYGQQRLLSPPVRVQADFVRDNVVPHLQDLARNGVNGSPFDLRSPEMSYAKNLYNEGVSIADMKKITSVNFDRMEQWRGRVSAAEQSAFSKGDKAAGTFLKNLRLRYDAAMENLPMEAVKSGNPEILDSINKARSARATQGKFERHDIIGKIVQDPDLTGEQALNTIYGSATGLKNPDAIDTIRALKQFSPDKAATDANLKRAAFSKLLRDSMGFELQSGTNAPMLSFDKLSTNLDGLINRNRSLFNELVTDPSERQKWIGLLNDAKQIKSIKPGGKNYSNTAYTILNSMRAVSPSLSNFGMAGINLNNIMGDVAKGTATFDLKKSISPVLKGFIDETMDAPIHAAAVGSGSAASGNQGTQRKPLK